MKKLLLAALLCSLSTTAVGAEENWMKISESPDYEIFLDTNDVTQYKNGARLAWEMWKSKPTSSERFQGRRVSRLVTARIFACDASVRQSLSVSLTRHFSDGGAPHTMTRPEPWPAFGTEDWNTTKPGSVGETITKVVCDINPTQIVP